MLLRIAAVLLLCGLGMARAQPTRLTLGFTPIVDDTPSFVAADQGFFARHGLDVTIQIVPGGGALPGALMSGSLQVVAVSMPLMLQSASQGVPIGCFATAAMASHRAQNGGAVVRSGLTLHGPGDFEGHVVGVSSVGSFYQVMFAQWLEDHGADPKRVRFVETPFPQQQDLLRAGQVDASLVPEPFASRIVKAGIGRLAFPYLNDFADGLITAAYCADRHWAAAHGTELRAFRAALEDARAFILANPASARDSMEHWLKLPASAANAVEIADHSVALGPDQLREWDRIGKRQALIPPDFDINTVLLP